MRFLQYIRSVDLCRQCTVEWSCLKRASVFVIESEVRKERPVKKGDQNHMDESIKIDLSRKKCVFPSKVDCCH